MSEVWLDSATWTYKPHAGSVLSERFKGKLFDSYFAKNIHYTQNHHLFLHLRINLKPVTGQTVAPDHNRRNFPIKEWTADEWLSFTTQFERQSQLWNNRFWLIPPKHFSLLDFKNGGRTIRPNIKCLLRTEVTNNAANAHKVIEVVNLDVDAIKRQMGITPGSGTYRSNSGRYDSLDVKPRDTSYQDDKDVEHTIKNYYTIAHEIGHAIGLKHIGSLKSRQQCLFAIALKKFGVKNVSSHLQKGGDAPVCYGRYDSAGLAENIMGLGTKFEEINAQPWLDRIIMHTNTLAADWKIHLTHKAPQTVSG